MIIDTIRLAVTLAMKDLRLYARDKTGLALGFLLPIALVAVFASVLGSIGARSSSDDPATKQALPIADMDHSEASRKLLAAFEQSKLARAITDESEGVPYTRDTLYDAVRKGNLGLGFVIESGFGAKLDAGEMPSIEVIRDSSREIEFQFASQSFFMAIMDAHGEKLGRAMAIHGIRTAARETGIGPDAVSAAEKLAGSFFDYFDHAIQNSVKTPSGSTANNDDDANGFTGMASMLGIKETTVGGGERTGKEKNRVMMVSQSVAGTAVMMVLFGLVACGGTLLREREEGTLRRLFVTPAPRGAILAGKFLFTFVLGLAQLGVMFAFGTVAFSLPVRGHITGMVVASVALAAAATSFGVFIASIGRTQKQVEGFSTLVILVMSAVGGSWIPMVKDVVPDWMVFASHFTLNAWAMDAFHKIWWLNLPVSDILLEIGVLFAIALVLSTLATILFRKRFASAEGV